MVIRCCTSFSFYCEWRNEPLHSRRWPFWILRKMAAWNRPQLVDGVCGIAAAASSIITVTSLISLSNLKLHTLKHPVKSLSWYAFLIINTVDYDQEITDHRTGLDRLRQYMKLTIGGPPFQLGFSKLAASEICPNIAARASAYFLVAYDVY